MPTEIKHVIIGTAGHIDHGKTSLVGRLTGINTDRLPEEKARGISIDLGFAHWEAERDGQRFQFGVVDVPGHERFVKNMVAGATGVDLALLVVAADDSVMPQTLEHLEIMDLLGIATGVVAITKIDLAAPDFVELVQAEIEERVQGTFLEGCSIIPVSSQTGAGLDLLKETLLDVASKQAWQQRSELFRLPIDRVFSLPGHGTVVTGTVLGGEVVSGDTLDLLPQGVTVRVRSVQNHGSAAEESGERQRTAINLAGIKADEVERGQELSHPGYLKPTKRLLVSLRCLSHSPLSFKDRLPLSLHIGTREVAARVILKGKLLAPGERGYAELRLREPIVASYGQRFILRRPSPALTVGGGVVLDPGLAPRQRVKDPAELGKSLDVADPLARLSVYLAHRDQVDDDPLPAAWRAGIPPRQYKELIGELLTRRELAKLGVRDRGTRLIHRDRVIVLAVSVMKRIRAEMQRHQPRRALPKSLLLSVCQNLAPPDLLEPLFEQLVREKQLAAVGPNFGPADLQVQLTKAQIAARTKILELVTQAALAPPTVKELAAAVNQKSEQVEVLLSLCVEDGLLVRASEELYFTPAALDGGRRRCREFLATNGPATMSQLREAWGVSRKFSVPLCELFDSRGWTLRDGDLRTAGPKLEES
jgi:selenocysteine-specific elongation factor